MREQFKSDVLEGNTLPQLDLRQFEDGTFADSRTEMCYIGWSLAERNKVVKKQEALDNDMVDFASKSMKLKMARSRMNGKSGWETCSIERLQNLLLTAAFNNDYVDACNYAGMLLLLDVE